MARGRGDHLPGRTFSAPRKWMKGKGRITIQYGVCYSYAHPIGITNDVVEAMPKTLNSVIDRMVRWGVLPASVRPDSVRPCFACGFLAVMGPWSDQRRARSASLTSTRRLTVRCASDASDAIWRSPFAPQPCRHTSAH